MIYVTVLLVVYLLTSSLAPMTGMDTALHGNYHSINVIDNMDTNALPQSIALFVLPCFA